MDEEYLLSTLLMPLVTKSEDPDEMGKVLMDDLRERQKDEQTRSLTEWLIAEMKTESPGGKVTILPPSIRRSTVNQASDRECRPADCPVHLLHGAQDVSAKAPRQTL